MDGKPKTRIALILDRSGSMEPIRRQAVAHYNEQVQEIRRKAAEGQDIRVSTLTFNGDVYVHLWEEPAEALGQSTEEGYKPDGATAMRDAIGYAVTRLSESEDQEASYLIVVVSDGEENASKHVGADELREMIESKQASGRWTFAYLGCDESYLERVARETSIPIGNMAAWSHDNAWRVAQLAHSYTANYLDRRATGASGVCDFYAPPQAESFGHALQSTAADAPVLRTSATNAPAEDVFGTAGKVHWKAKKR